MFAFGMNWMSYMIGQMQRRLFSPHAPSLDSGYMKDIFRAQEKVRKVFPERGKTNFLCAFKLGDSPGSLKIMTFEIWRETGLDITLYKYLKNNQTLKLFF